MRILHLTPGTGTFHCGSCLRDNALIKALRGRGHDAMMVPLYLPLVTDREQANPGAEIHVGGVSLYLQHKYPWFHRLPKFVHRWINHPKLLRKAAARMGMTRASVLGEMTVGSLKGKDSPQWAEWQKLINWIRDEAKPDLVSLSNSLLTGLAPTLKNEVGVPVVCSLQGEDSFLDTLPEPYLEQAWSVLSENAESVERFIAPSAFYQKVMAERLGLEEGHIAVVPNGVNAHSFPTAEGTFERPVIGYLARMIEGKGLGTMVDAFIELTRDGRHPAATLHLAGAMTPVDVDYVEQQKAKLKQAGLESRVQWSPNLSFEEKLEFLRRLSIFSVPAGYGEAFGLYVIEAMAARIPVVQPRHGAFPELIEATGGGLLCETSASSLAEGWERILTDRSDWLDLGAAGQQAVLQDFTPVRMAERFDAVLDEMLHGQAAER